MMRTSSRKVFFTSVSAVFLGVLSLCAQGATPAQAEAAKLAKARKPPSFCVGLDESACAGKSDCYWRKATTTKTGKARRAHCRIKRSANKSPPA